MKVVKMKLSELVKPDKNVRIHTDKQIKEYRRSVEMFGQIRPIVVDENQVILAGRGLYDTLVDMGKDTADVYQYDNLTENQKKKLMIADNKIFSLGIDNMETLNSFLEELQEDLDIPGFDEEILRQMVSDAEDITDKLSEYGTLDDEEIKNIKEKGERKELRIQSQSETQGDRTPGNVSTAQIQQEPNPEGENGDAAEIKKFVICPQCGEKIWL